MLRISISDAVKRTLAVALTGLSVLGCWTFDETAYPRVALTALKPGAPKTLLVNGFETVLTSYEAVYGYSTVMTPGYYGYHGYYPGYCGTVTTQTIVPNHYTSDRYRRRAIGSFENAGFKVVDPTHAPITPDYVIDASFDGPMVDANEPYASLAWNVFSLFLCDYATRTYSANVRIRDNRTGELVFNQTYERRYETKVFSLIPIFGIASCNNTSPSFMQNWCLAALTDQVVADATSVLAGAK